MLKSCTYCGRIHDRGEVCQKKPKRQKQGKREAEKIRNTYGWQQTRKRVKERDCFLCAYCLSKGIINHKCLEVHHIIPLDERQDLAFEDDNLITLCDGDHEDAEAGKITREELLYLAGHPPRGYSIRQREAFHTDYQHFCTIYSQNETEVKAWRGPARQRLYWRRKTGRTGRKQN